MHCNINLQSSITCHLRNDCHTFLHMESLLPVDSCSHEKNRSLTKKSLRWDFQ